MWQCSSIIIFKFAGKSSLNADKTDEASNVAVDVAAGIKDKKEDN